MKIVNTKFVKICSLFAQATKTQRNPAQPTKLDVISPRSPAMAILVQAFIARDCSSLYQWFFIEEGKGIGVDVAGIIDQVLGRDVNFVVDGWEKGANQKLAG